jgi:hypothetical protein
MLSVLITVMLAAAAATDSGELPRPIFYLPLDGSTTAAIAAGNAYARETTSPESILTLVETQRPKFYPGRVGRCYEVGDTPLVFPSKGNLSAREGAISFWLHPQFRGDDKNLYCIFFSAGPWGMLYKYRDQSSLTFATAKPSGDWYYDCGVGGIGGWGPGQAHHVAVCWSRQGNFRRLYVDGKLGRQAPFPFHKEFGDEPLVIGGGSQNYATNVAHARIEQVGIWDRPLDDRAVARLFALGKVGKPLLKMPAGSEAGVPESDVVKLPAPLPGGAAEANPPAWQQPTLTRQRLVLDGSWRFLPLEHAASNLPAVGWGTAKVPGFWTDRDNVCGSDGRPARGHWALRPLADYPLVCYLRTFTVEPRWQHQPAFLALDGVDGLAEVFLNGRLVGRLAAWEPEAYDVGDLLRFGQPNTLLIRLRARRECRSPGIYGSVALEIMPRAFIKDVAVDPSVDRGEIRFSCDAWHSGETAAGQLEFEIAAWAGDGPVEKRFRQEFQLSGRKSAGRELSAACQRIECTLPWRDARLWTYDDPALYGVRVRLYSGTTLLDQSPPVRFGFREFTRHGSELLLNGKPTHLRGHQLALSDANAVQRLKDFKAAGMNSFECLGPIAHTWYQGTPYRLAEYEQVLDYADRNGMVAVPLLPDLMQIRERIFEPRVAERFSQRLDKHIRRFGNHPSVCTWYMHFNLAGYHWYCAPSTWDGSYKPADATFQAKERFAMEAQRMTAALDRRPLFHHACGNFSDMFTGNIYLGPNCPLQEREEWPMRWAERRPFPLLACEHGMMLIPYWFRPRQFPLEVVYSGEPIFDEIAAIYLGRRAYQMLTPEVFQAYDLGGKPGHQRLHALIEQHRGYQEVKSLFARHSLRSWRTFGVSGIFFNAIAWDFKDAAERPLPVMQALARYFGDTDLYIAGPGNDWPSKDHAFFSGETIRKQVVLLNDLTRDLPCRLAWRVQDAAGAAYASGQIETIAQAGAARMCPLEFSAPQVVRRTLLRLTVEPLSAAVSPFRPDELVIEVFPRPGPATVAGKILLYDPLGDTAAMLSRAGVHTQPLTGDADLQTASLLIVGRKSYGPALLTLARRIGLERAVADGLNLLVLEQTAAKVLGLRLHEQSQRQVFVACPGHKLLAGLAPEDFINLRGQSDLIDAYPDAPPGTEHGWPARCFKWGNRGITATCVYTKPHYAPVVPILESGYDLTDSPLLEAAIDRGRVVLCQVDVTPRYGTDPVATRLVDNILRELAVRGTEPLLPCACTGPSARAWVRPFGVEPATFDGHAKSLIVVGTEPLAGAEKKSLLAAVAQGATALLLPGSLLAADVGESTTPRRCFLARPGGDPLLAGVSDADLYLKAWTELPAVAVENGWQALAEPAVVARKPFGRGQIVACLLDPAHCGEHGRIKTLRLWNVLLANLHARRSIEGGFLQPKMRLYEANTWEEMPPYMNW